MTISGTYSRRKIIASFYPRLFFTQSVSKLLKEIEQSLILHSCAFKACVMKCLSGHVNSQTSEQTCDFKMQILLLQNIHK